MRLKTTNYVNGEKRQSRGVCNTEEVTAAFVAIGWIGKLRPRPQESHVLSKIYRHPMILN
jgi:hypothetical protein